MQAVYFGAAWVSMASGVGAGVNAVIVCAYPVVTAIAARPVLGERIGAAAGRRERGSSSRSRADA